MIASRMTDGVKSSRSALVSGAFSAGDVRRAPSLRNALVLGLTLAVVVVSAAGCVGYGSRDPKGWPPDRKAKEITRLRKLAREYLQKYGVSRNIEDLAQVVEAERQTTEIAPSTCPTCFREYGLALSMEGRHYSYLLEDVRAELRTAAPEQKASLQEEADSYLAERVRYLDLSRRAYEGYFNHPATTAVAPRDLRRVMNDQEILGNYDSALLYLKLFKASLGPDIPDVLQEALKDRFAQYTREVRAMEERRERERERQLLEEEVPSGRPAPSPDRN